MKKLLLVTFFTAITAQYSFAQDSTKTNQLSSLLGSYYDIKNALVGSDATTAATKASEFFKAVNAVDMNTMPEADHKAFMPLKEKLAFDARHISESTSIEHQREHFASLSTNMYALAKKVKLSEQPIYQEYCPMKKSYWLSTETMIKNPYYGKAMLTCGQVTQTLK